MRSQTFLSAVLLAGLSLSATAPAQDVDKLPSILVSGHGEVEDEPDRATFNYTLRGEGPTSDDAVRAMVSMGTRIEAAIKGVDADAEPRTGSIETQAVKSSDCKEEDYRAKLLSTGSCAILGYVATQAITIVTSRVKDSGTMIGLAGRGGAQDASSSRFSLSRKTADQALVVALAEAFRNAAVNGSALASGSGLRLGAILSATNVRGVEVSSAQEIVITGSRLPQSYAAPPVTVALKPQKIVTSADVTVRYAIAR